MSALLVLMAGLALGSDGTDRTSTETEQRLAIDGYWGGIVQISSQNEMVTYKVKLEPGRTMLVILGLWINQTWVDEGQGKCRLIRDRKFIGYGIYKRERGQLVICCGDLGNGRPIAFQADETHNLFILKPTKPPR
jgi:hypothetical protein